MLGPMDTHFPPSTVPGTKYERSRCRRNVESTSYPSTPYLGQLLSLNGFIFPLLISLTHPLVVSFSLPFLSSSTVNSVLEAARKAKSAVIIQVSNGGGAFYAGKGLKTADQAAIGSV